MDSPYQQEHGIVQEITSHPQTAAPGSLAAKFSIIASVVVIMLNLAQVTVLEGKSSALTLAQIMAISAVLAGVAGASAGLFRAWTCRDSNVIILAAVGLLLNGGLLATGFVKPPIKGGLNAEASSVKTHAVITQSGRTIITEDWTAGFVVQLTDATFDDVINNSRSPVLVDCWAPWCGPCRRMSPVIEELAADFKDQVKVCKLNVNVARNTSAKLGIRGIPTILLYKNGRILKQWVGMTDKSAIMLEINKLL